MAVATLPVKKTPDKKLKQPPYPSREELSPEEQEEAQRILAQGRQDKGNESKEQATSPEEQEYNQANIGRGGVLPAARPTAEEGEPDASREPENVEESKKVDALGAGKIASSANELSIAEQLRRLRQTYERVHRGAISSTFRLKNRYKQMKRLIRVIKIASAAGSSLGDIFFSLAIFFLTLNGEFIYSKISKNYPFDLFDKFFFVVGWLLILAIVALVAVIIILIYYFASFLLQSAA